MPTPTTDYSATITVERTPFLTIQILCTGTDLHLVFFRCSSYFSTPNSWSFILFLFQMDSMQFEGFVFCFVLFFGPDLWVAGRF